MHIRRDAFGEQSETIALGAYERAAVLYNLGALQASLAGMSVSHCGKRVRASYPSSTAYVCATESLGCFFELQVFKLPHQLAQQYCE
jgi:hypothetical protein